MLANIFLWQMDKRFMLKIIESDVMRNYSVSNSENLIFKLSSSYRLFKFSRHCPIIDHTTLITSLIFTSYDTLEGIKSK